MINGIQAVLITGGDGTGRESEILKTFAANHLNLPDVVEIGSGSGRTGIADIRSFIARLHLRPTVSPVTAGIIRNAETMTPEAQNALLKTLEEPPDHAMLILETGSPDLLLPTVISRCRMVRLAVPVPTADNPELPEITAFTLSRRLAANQMTVHNRDEARTYIDNLLHRLKLRLTRNSPDDNAPVLIALARKTFHAKILLESNVWFLACIDSIFL